jgi:hypothetical protein
MRVTSVIGGTGGWDTFDVPDYNRR